MMSMLKNFFSIQKDNKRIFEGLAITKHKEFCKKWMNQYPVISISFKEVDGMDRDCQLSILLTLNLPNRNRCNVSVDW